MRNQNRNQSLDGDYPPITAAQQAAWPTQVRFLNPQPLQYDRSDARAVLGNLVHPRYRDPSKDGFPPSLFGLDRGDGIFVGRLFFSVFSLFDDFPWVSIAQILGRRPFSAVRARILVAGSRPAADYPGSTIVPDA